MALKKPSEFFGKNIRDEDNSGIQVESNSNESLREELVKIESISDQVSQLKKEITEKVVKTDLENMILNQISLMNENFNSLKREIQQSNQKDINHFTERALELSNIVRNLVEEEIPKYKKNILKNEFAVEEKITEIRDFSDEKISEIKDTLNENIFEIRQEIDGKIENISNVVDDNLQQFTQQLEDTSSQVKKTTKIYSDLSNILEKKVSEENEKLTEYALIIEDIQKSFNELQKCLQEESNSYKTVIEQKLENFNENLDEKVESIVDQVSDLQGEVSSKIKDLKTEVSILEQHNKKLTKNFKDLKTENNQGFIVIEKYIQNHKQDLQVLKDEVFTEIENLSIGNLQENIQRVERKIDDIREIYSRIEPEVVVKEVIQEGLLNEPPETKNSDPSTPLNKNFVTLEQLQEHYRLFINRIQQQLSTLGGGGETQLKYLDDVVGIATNASAYDGKYLKYDHASKKFIFDSVTIEVIQENIVYVSKNGNDLNDGSFSKPKLTIKAGVGIAVTDTVVKILPGTYIEDNPISIPDQVTLIGESLRETTVIPLNDNQDLFYVGNGCYISEMSFSGSLLGKSVIAFDPNNRRYINQSPYVQNCTNFIPNSIGLKVDGKDAIGPLKSIVLDAYTQYNQGGIGVSITNDGYTQLVSLFTICNDIAVYCGSGGACDLTNSNSSFGNYGLVADGVSGKKYTGIVTVAAAEQSDVFVLNFSTPTLNVTDADYDNTTGFVEITVNQPHNLNVGTAVTISGLGFTCPYEPGTLYYPSGNKGYIFNVETVTSSTSFIVNVGIASQPHYYSSGGTVKIYVVRPYDGQALYFNNLYYTVKTLNITNGGSGYTEKPTITISPPAISWGVKAQAAPIIENGVLVGVDMISNGRGYEVGSPPTVTISGPQVGINTAVATVELIPEYYTVNKSSEITGDISVVTLNENIPFAVGVGTEVNFFKQSRILATSYSFEYVGSGTNISSCLPFSGGVTIEENETDSRNGGLVVYTSTNQSGNFKIGDGVTINQNVGSITGKAYTKSLLSTMTPYILSLGGF